MMTPALELSCLSNYWIMTYALQGNMTYQEPSPSGHHYKTALPSSILCRKIVHPESTTFDDVGTAP